jgi:hypothetical protein
VFVLYWNTYVVEHLRGQKRDKNDKHDTKPLSKIKRKNVKIQYEVDARLCPAQKHVYKIFSNEEFIFIVSIY